MAGSLRFLVRSAVTNGWSNTRTASTTATSISAALKSCGSLSFSRTPYRRCLHATAFRAVASPEPASVSKPSPPAQDDPNWRHPRYGLAAADFPRLVCIKIPHKTTEADMKVLIAKAGFPDAQVTMTYLFETGSSGPYCFVKLADENQVTAAIAELSRFTFFGLDLEPEKYDPAKFPSWRQPSLFAGWKPSPSSDVKSRVVRPPITEPPELLVSLMAEQWVQFQNLPPVDPSRKSAYFEILREFYKKFHQYDVVGITKMREHSFKPNGWCCKIQFGSPKEAEAARKSYVEAGQFMGREARAKVHRGGPNVHKILWDYRQSLPGDTPQRDVGALLEQKYREILAKDRPSYHRSEYPTPESAVRLKNTERTSG